MRHHLSLGLEAKVTMALQSLADEVCRLGAAAPTAKAKAVTVGFQPDGYG